jgi:glycosyltransferase involved in cell wall biosynthesis
MTNHPPILMVIPGLPMGGAETFFVRLAVGLTKRGHDVTVYLPSIEGDASLLEALTRGRVEVVCPWWRRGFIFKVLYKGSILLNKIIPRFQLVDLLDRRKLYDLKRRKGFSVVNAHLTLAELLVCKAFRDSDVRIVGSDHGDYRWAVKGAYRRELGVVFQRSDVLVCPSEDNRRVAQQFEWTERTAINVIKYGYDFTSAAFKTKGERGLFTFGMVSRGIEEKGWLQAVAAFQRATLNPSFDARFILVGEGPTIDQLKSRVEQSGNLRDRVVFAGYQAHPEEFICSFDVGVLPSFYQAESLPNVIIEYLAHSLPVIATQWAGIPEMIRTDDGVAGVLVGFSADGKPSVDELSDAMLRLATDRTRYLSCLKQVSAARSAFDIELCLDSYAEVLFGSPEAMPGEASL